MDRAGPRGVWAASGTPDAANRPLATSMLMVIALAGAVGVSVLTTDLMPSFQSMDRWDGVALRLSGGDSDGDGRSDHLRLNLVNAYGRTVRDAVAVGEAGVHIWVHHGTRMLSDEGGRVCTAPPGLHGAAPEACPPGHVFGIDELTWSAGQRLFVPCLGAGEHLVIADAGQLAPFEATYACEEPAGR